MNRRRVEWALFAQAVLAAGCADAPAARGAGVSIVDSAGVRIVENGTPAPAPSDLRLAPDPLFRVGWEEDEPGFQLIFAGAVMDEDRVAVSDVARVHVFSSAGERLYSVGGEGEGPGEFQAVYSVLSAGADTLVMHDYTLGRVTTFDGPTLVGTARVVPPIVDHRHIAKGRGPDGELILVPTGSYPADGPDDEWLPVPILRYDRGDAAMDTIARLDFQRLGRTDLFRPIGWSAVADSVLVHARGDRPEVRWYDLSGRLLQIARWTGGEPALDAEFWSSFEDQVKRIRRYREMPDADFRARVSEWQEGADGGVPVYGTLFADAGANVWLSEWMPFNQPPRSYTLIAADGVFVGSLEVPEGFRAIAFGEDVVLGYELNEVDVPAAALYRIEGLESVVSDRLTRGGEG